MALLPSFTLIIGAVLFIPLRGSRSRLVSLISAGLALGFTGLLSQQLPAATEISLWRPIELFGSGFLFTLNEASWALMLLGSAVILAEVLLAGQSLHSLLYAGIALAAVAAGNPLTVVVLWTLMIAFETGLRLTASEEIGPCLRLAGTQFAAVVAVIAAVYVGEAGALFLATAVLIRSLGGANARFPFGLAIMAPLSAMAIIGRSPYLAPQLTWIAGLVITVAFVQALAFNTRLTWFALALAAAVLAAQPTEQSLVGTSAAAALVVTVALLYLGKSRFTWATIAVIPFAYFSADSGLGQWSLAIFVAAALVSISRLQAESDKTLPFSRVESVSIMVLAIAAVLALVSSGWLPSLGGALLAVVGLAVGYLISRSHTAINKMHLPIQRPLEAAKKAGQALINFIAAAIRTTVDVLEGESAVLWILLVLLIAIIGLQMVAA